MSKQDKPTEAVQSSVHTENKPKDDKVVIYASAYNAKFSKLLKSEKRPNGLLFENGIAVITKEELAEIKKSEYWNRAISDKELIKAGQKAQLKVHVERKEN